MPIDFARSLRTIKTGDEMAKENNLERIFETFLWNSRLGTIIVVILSALASLGMFVLGSIEIIVSLQNIFHTHLGSHVSESILISVISALDHYLIGIVLVIFSFGVYELFISQIDVADRNKHITILNITSLDELKNKLLKVIIMVLIVSFSKTVLSLDFTTALDMLYFALAILALAASVFLIRKKESGE
jgi:uncharacterized membrane protein YqhA